MAYQTLNRSVPKHLMAGGSVILALGLLFDRHSIPALLGSKDADAACQEVVQAQKKLSREQLAQLLTVPEGDKKQKVRAVLQEPYCKLASLQVRAGATAQREAYPLDFDSQTWLIILYEGNQYVGYRFNPR